MLCLYWSALDNNLHVNYLFKNTAQTKLVLVIGWERFSSLLFSSVYLHFTRKVRRIDIEAFRLTKCNDKIFVKNFSCFTNPWTMVSLETWLSFFWTLLGQRASTLFLGWKGRVCRLTFLDTATFVLQKKFIHSRTTWNYGQIFFI